MVIGKLKGEVVEIMPDYVIVEVNDVGYMVYLTNSNIQSMSSGIKVALYIETHIREDSIQLFGFTNMLEKKCFLMLISVSGVGPRMALAILDIMSPAQVQASIIGQDLQNFLRATGIGKKLAERIILELKDKVSKILGFHALAFDEESGSSAQLSSEAILALVALGINYNDATDLVNQVLSKTQVRGTDEIIKMALRYREK